jgi:putative transposase
VKRQRYFPQACGAGAQPDSDIPSRSPVGVDLGLKAFATLSTGESIIAPKPLQRAQARLRRLNRRLARTERASNNHRKAAMRLARQRRRARNIRQDFLHRFATRLATNRSEICIEDLNAPGMAKNQGLALPIYDAAWGEARRQLKYKTVLYGSKLTVRDRFYASSRLCSACGWKRELLSLSDRKWTLLNGGRVHDRDHNAAINLWHVPQAIWEFTPLKIAALAFGKTGREPAVVERGTLPCAHIRAQER